MGALRCVSTFRLPGLGWLHPFLVPLQPPLAAILVILSSHAPPYPFTPLHAPPADCKAAVPRRVISAVADGPHRGRYEEFAVRSFVDDQRQIVWCPAPGQRDAERRGRLPATAAMLRLRWRPPALDCWPPGASLEQRLLRHHRLIAASPRHSPRHRSSPSALDPTPPLLLFTPSSHAADCQNAVVSMSDQRGAAQDVFCRCGAAFCFNCKEEAHRPVDCETVRKWLVGSAVLPFLFEAQACAAFRHVMPSLPASCTASSCMGSQKPWPDGRAPFDMCTPLDALPCADQEQRGEREHDLDPRQHKALPQVHVRPRRSQGLRAAAMPLVLLGAAETRQPECPPRPPRRP
jgi:hypothetical protein